MSNYVPIGLLLLVLVVLIIAGLRKSSAPVYPVTFEAEPLSLPDKWHLFTPAERAFLQALDEAIGNEYRVFGKLRLEDIVADLRRQPDTFISWQSASLMHVDFVVCDHEDLTIVACIELDDKTHQYDDVKRRDAEKDRALKAAGVPCLRFPARAIYDPDEIRGRLWDALHITHTLDKI